MINHKSTALPNFSLWLWPISAPFRKSDDFWSQIYRSRVPLTSSDPSQGRSPKRNHWGQTKQPHCNGSLWVGECMYQLSIWIGDSTQAETVRVFEETGFPNYASWIRCILMGLHKLSNFGTIPLTFNPWRHRGFLPRHLAIWAYATFDLFSLATGLTSTDDLRFETFLKDAPLRRVGF